MANEPSTTLDLVSDKAVVYDVCFLSNAKTAHTLHFAGGDGRHVYVDVSDDSPPIPIALSLVHKPGLVDYVEVPNDTELPLRHLFAFASQLIAFDKECRVFSRQDNSETLVPAHTLSRQDLIANATRGPLPKLHQTC